MDPAKQWKELAELEIEAQRLEDTITDAVAGLRVVHLRTAEIEQQMRLNTDEQSQITEISIGWDGKHE
jgi:hypothetical protein